MATIWAVVVGGGGGGGTVSGNGGNCGQINSSTALSITTGSYPVTVGTGGAGGTNPTVASNGTDGDSSVFSSISSGGGLGGNGGATGAGGSGYGVPGNAGPGGNGGQGFTSYISGSLVVYGGGGGGSNTGAPGGTGGIDGGGNGSQQSVTNATAGIDGLGGGGGGAWLNQLGADGGDGVVVLAYRTDGSDGILTSSSGGIVTTSGGYTIHTFTTSGTFNAVTSTPPNVNESATFINATSYANQPFETQVNVTTDSAMNLIQGNQLTVFVRSQFTGVTVTDTAGNTFVLKNSYLSQNGLFYIHSYECNNSLGNDSNYFVATPPSNDNRLGIWVAQFSGIKSNSNFTVVANGSTYATTYVDSSSFNVSNVPVVALSMVVDFGNGVAGSTSFSNPFGYTNRNVDTHIAGSLSSVLYSIPQTGIINTITTTTAWLDKSIVVVTIEATPPSNVIKSATTVSTGTIKKNNFLIGVSSSVDYGPTITTNFWSSINPPLNGYTVYAQKSSQGPSIRLAANDSDLITIAKQYGGTSINTVYDAITYFSGNPTYMVTNINYPNIITNGLTAIWDGGFLPSYPRTGTTWSDLSGNNYDLALVGSPVYSGSTIQTLLVGGGGGGSLGGGGGGQVYENLVENISTGAYSVIIGSGGTGSVTNTGLRGTNGGNTSFNNFIAYGGGAGGADSGSGNQNGLSGGNGGGGGNGSGVGGTGIQFDGGSTTGGAPFFPGSGGGGATQKGVNSTNGADGGNGGLGYLSSINGTSLRYGGGGGGGVYAAAGTGGSAGDASAGAGGNTVTNGGNGAANRGGGGGGGGNGSTGGNGGSGVVIITYKTDGSDGVSTGSTGGVITTSGAYTIHTFTASSTFSAVTLNGSGGVYFDGVNDTAQSSTITLSYPQGYSLSMWFEITSLASSGGLFSFNNGNFINFAFVPGPGGWFGWETGSGQRLYWFDDPVAGQLYNITCTYDPNTSISTIYNNATQVAIDTNAAVQHTSQTAQLKLDNSPSFPLFNGIIYSCYFYTNKVLTPTEIAQNYNALKGRYGL